MKVTDKYVDPIESAKAKAIADYEVKTKQDVPGEIIDLPSQGKFYPKNHPLRTGKIEMKYMTARGGRHSYKSFVFKTGRCY